VSRRVRCPVERRDSICLVKWAARRPLRVARYAALAEVSLAGKRSVHVSDSTPHVSRRYTERDHEFRDHDRYAGSKNHVTLRWLSGENRGSRLFNIGCGNGVFNGQAAAAGFEVTAFEPDPDAFRIAAATAPPHCSVEQRTLAEIDGESVADVIVMHDVLEHIEDDHAAVRRLRRLLRPGGQLILSVPALPSLFGMHDEELGHCRRYTRKSLRAALSPTFRIRRLRYFGMWGVPVVFWYSRYRRRPYPYGRVEQEGLAAQCLGLVCRVEERIPVPIGTSLLCAAD